ncbi:MAG: AMP-binding protein, partial [Candidatus Bathyarchaeia archaeon]
MIDKYGPPKELWPIIKLDFPEAKNWPQKLNIAEILVDENVRLGRDKKTAILHENQAITYGELQLSVNRFGNALKSLGMEIGDRVIICLPNIPEFIISHLAVQKIGCVSVPIHPLLRAKELSYIANNCEAKTIIAGPQIIGELEKSRNELKTIKHIILVKVGYEEFKFPFLSFDEVMEEFKDKIFLKAVHVDQGEIALLQYTSGTTGLPKGCIHTHRDYLVAGECFAKKLMMSNENDVWGGPVSLAFSFGHNSMITNPMYTGGSSSLFGDR